MGRIWPALVLRAPAVDDPRGADDLLAALLDDYSIVAIEDLAEPPLPPGGLWDPTFPPIPDPPPSPLHWRVYFADPAGRGAAAEAIAAACPQMAMTCVDVPDEDWAARSQASLRAVTAGRFIVAPPWDIPAEVPEGATLIVIEPSMGFGTGHHQTTRLCLRLLSNVDVTGRDVLDIGTGSGVLAMAAALSGARRAEGIDVDVDAIASAEASATLNPVPLALRFRVADFRAGPVAPAGIVLANLTGGMLTATSSALAALVQSGGTLILSGFDRTEVDGVLGAFRGFVEHARLTEDTWAALHLYRSAGVTGHPTSPVAP